MSRRPSPPTGRGPIEADAIYPVATFLRRLGIGRHSLTAMRRAGLPVRFIGRRAMVDGQEALEFLRQVWRSESCPEDSLSDAQDGKTRQM